MGAVISFIAWKNHGKTVEISKPCDRPFHHEEYVFDLTCVRCDVTVTLEAHPALPEPMWYG